MEKKVIYAKIFPINMPISRIAKAFFAKKENNNNNKKIIWMESAWLLRIVQTCFQKKVRHCVNCK